MPVARHDPWGAQLQFGSGHTLLAPIAPGLVERVELAEFGRLLPGIPVTLALNGERELELDPHAPLTVTLDLHGPLTLDIDAILAHAARHGLLHPRRALALGHTSLHIRPKLRHNQAIRGLRQGPIDGTSARSNQ